MSTSAISSNAGSPQTTPIAHHHHKRAASVKAHGTSQASQIAANQDNSNGSANYQGVSGASGRIDIHA